MCQEARAKRFHAPGATVIRIAYARALRAGMLGQQGRDMRQHDLPAVLRKAHPGLALAPDHVRAAHRELEVHRGEVAAEREDLEPDALVLDAEARRSRDPLGVDG